MNQSIGRTFTTRSAGRRAATIQVAQGTIQRIAG